MDDLGLGGDSSGGHDLSGGETDSAGGFGKLVTGGAALFLVIGAVSTGITTSSTVGSTIATPTTKTSSSSAWTHADDLLDAAEGMASTASDENSRERQNNNDQSGYESRDRSGNNQDWYSDAGGQRANRDQYAFRVPRVTEAYLAPSGRVEPIYPKSALSRRREGHVTVAVDIDRRGRPVHAIVIGPGPSRAFDKAAWEAAMSSRYVPKREDGRAVNGGRVIIEYKFEIEDDGRRARRRS